MKMGRRRFAKEWQAYEHPPEVHSGGLFRKGRADAAQVHRSLVQINFYRRER
jgi:hypothetical protein